MSADVVSNEELLYRRVPRGRGLYSHTLDGRIELSSQLFADRERRASVDRAKLCNSDPSYTQQDFADGVIAVLASDVRGITGLVQYDANQRPGQTFRAEIIPDPILPNNPDN